MPTNLRRLGVYGDSLPTKKSKTVRASDFNIGGILGLFERKYVLPKLCNNITEFAQIFGNQETSTYYGWDAVKGFFDNVAGVDAKLYVCSHVGFAAAIDGVVATTGTTILDTALASFRLDSAYEGALDYSTWGNRTGYTITQGSRFATAASGSGVKTDTWAILDSVSDIKVGDIVKFMATGDAVVTVYKIVLTVDETLGKITFAAAFDAAAYLKDNDIVTVPGFQLKLWRKSSLGIITQVEEELGKIYCTLEDAVSDYFVENVFASSKYVKVTDLHSAGALGTTLPATVAAVTYLTAGANGTAPTTTAHWASDLLAFNLLPIRFLANPETTDVALQKAIEVYSRTRWDHPKVIFNVAENQTKAQYIIIGNGYQRSDDVLGVIACDWLKVSDPFASSALAADREIPNVGHVMGAWIRTISKYGIHFVPAIKEVPLYGINNIVRTTLWSDTDRTDLAKNGINIIDFINGSGFVIRNFFTPSTSVEFQFANGILMREYIKVSAVDSLQSSENTPNSFGRILADKDAILQFMLRLWYKGSTGYVAEGETFAQSEDVSGKPTKWSDHIQVQADAINNPQTSIQAGERNLDVWFSYPAPAGSIKIGVGILLLS